MPALYIGHGAPPLLDDPVWSGQLAGLAADLPRPRAILIVSAHWESAPVSLTASGAELVYDFGGFAPKYYRETYWTPDSSALAARVAGVTAGWPAAVRLIIDALHDVPHAQRPAAVAELTRLGVALGGAPMTFSGLAGMGDLVATCSSTMSRNHHVGLELGLVAQ